MLIGRNYATSRIRNRQNPRRGAGGRDAARAGRGRNPGFYAGRDARRGQNCGGGRFARARFFVDSRQRFSFVAAAGIGDDSRRGRIARVRGLAGFNLNGFGGFQVFSLRKTSAVREEGVAFRAPHSGESRFLSPETAVEIQRVLGVDIAMAFDECAPQPADEKTARAAMERTLRWAARSLAARGDSETALFGIAQGGVDSSLRAESIAKTTALGFDGYALGGLSVGESKEQTEATTRHAAALLPRAQPRYSMGVGRRATSRSGRCAGLIYSIACCRRATPATAICSHREGFCESKTRSAATIFARPIPPANARFAAATAAPICAICSRSASRWRRAWRHCTISPITAARCAACAKR